MRDSSAGASRDSLLFAILGSLPRLTVQPDWPIRTCKPEGLWKSRVVIAHLQLRGHKPRFRSGGQAADGQTQRNTDHIITFSWFP